MAVIAKKNTESKSLPAISEAELTKLVLDREHYKRLHKEHDALEADLKARQADLITRFEAGAKVESKVYSVAVDRSETRRNVKWKDKFLDLMKSIGKNPVVEEQKVLDSTIPDVYPKIVITER